MLMMISHILTMMLIKLLLYQYLYSSFVLIEIYVELDDVPFLLLSYFGFLVYCHFLFFLNNFFFSSGIML